MTAVLPDAVRTHQELADPLLRAAVSQLPAGLARIVAYHRGWVDADGVAVEGSPGKAVRPTLALLCAQAAGAAPLAGGPAAVAVELVHDFSLLHDDVMDRDTERRHRPTAWTVFGEAEAILAGDALVSLATRVLLEGAGPLGAPAVAELHEAVAALVEGQALDMAFERQAEVDLQSCLRMAQGKTAALLACACRLGALLGGAEAGTVDGLGRFGSHLGMAFQLVDDLLGVWGDPAVTGKPVLSDLRRRKKTLPVVAALANAAPDAAALAGFLAGTGVPTEESLRAAAEQLDRCGARAWAEQEAARRLGWAEAELDRLALPPTVAAELRAVARFTVARSR